MTDNPPSPAHLRALTLTLECTDDLVGVIAPGADSIWVNPATRSVLGLGPGPASLEAIADHVPPWVARKVADDVIPALRRHGSWEGELAIADREGDSVPLSVVATAVLEGGRIEAASIVARDISAGKALQAEMAHLATHDPLTGLANRACFLERLRSALGDRSDHCPGPAVLFLDIDRFKAINDKLGHAAGDAVLVTAARRLEHAVRDGDTVARWSGDEFVVLCPTVCGPSEATEIAERLRRSLAEPMALPDRTVEITASIGVATAPPGGVCSPGEAGDLVAQADLDMYLVKQRGPDQTVA